MMRRRCSREGLVLLEQRDTGIERPSQYQQAIEENDAICHNKQKVMKDEYHAMFDEAVRRIGVRNHTAVKIVL